MVRQQFDGGVSILHVLLLLLLLLLLLHVTANKWVYKVVGRYRRLASMQIWFVLMMLSATIDLLITVPSILR